MLSAQSIRVASVVYSEKAALPLVDVEHFVAGLVFGLVDHNDFPYIQTCLSDAKTLDEEITQAIADFAKKDIYSILDGIKMIGKALTELPKDLGECKEMQTDLKLIENWAQIFKHPLALAKTLTGNVWKNLPQIYSDVNQLMTDLTAHEMDDAGKEVADILVLALGPVVPKTEDTLF